jgi:Domain of unknown function (DUF4440)
MSGEGGRPRSASVCGWSGARRVRRPARCALTIAAIAIAGTLASATQPADDLSATLQRQTQELLDAIPRGDRAPWIRYLHESMIYAAEDGSVKNKAQLVDELRPFPKEIWGRIHIRQFRSVRHQSAAVTNYLIDEEEGYFGQVIGAQYLVTDTWVETPAGWRLVATEALALRTDPPAIDLPAARLDEFVGVYSLTHEITYTIRRGPRGLEGQRTGRQPEVLKVEVADCLFVPGQPRLRKIFQRDAAGAITGFVERRESWDIVWRRVR